MPHFLQTGCQSGETGRANAQTACTSARTRRENEENVWRKILFYHLFH